MSKTIVELEKQMAELEEQIAKVKIEEEEKIKKKKIESARIENIIYHRVQLYRLSSVKEEMEYFAALFETENTKTNQECRKCGGDWDGLSNRFNNEECLTKNWWTIVSF